MHIPQQITKWEIENRNSILGWKAEWDIKPGFKIVTFDYVNASGKKEKKIFEISVNNTNLAK